MDVIAIINLTVSIVTLGLVYGALEKLKGVFNPPIGQISAEDIELMGKDL